MTLKYVLLVAQVITSALCYSQQIVIPEKPAHIAESQFRNGELILRNSIQQLAADNNRITAHDYWNFATAYSAMGQPKEVVYDFLFKSKYTNANDFCEIVMHYHRSKKGIDSTGFFKLIGREYKDLVRDCPESISRDTFDLAKYISVNRFDAQLIHRLNDLLEKDQKFRKNSPPIISADQRLFDAENIREAEAIIATYGYPGTSIVGERFNHVVWMIIQHADLQYQEKYLPLIALTVENGDLNQIPLKMLLDRIYHRKTGAQIFGSQIGVPFADDKTIEEVKLKFKL